MELVFPDSPEYHFILKGLYSDKFATYPKFRCEALSNFEDDLTADVAFLPAPLAILNSRNYDFLRAGNIFSYFSGPQIFPSEQENKDLFVSDRDFVSEYYARILLNDVTLKRGKGSPMIMEPRIAMMSEQRDTKKVDLYAKWNKIANNLPLPLYSGMIKKSSVDLKSIVEDAINASVRYALDNSSEIIKDIATMYGIENLELLKRVMFQFINKNTLAMSEDEVESLEVLNGEMGNRGFAVSDLRF